MASPVLPLIFRLRKSTLSRTRPPGCPPRHRIFSASESELTPYSLIPAPGCQEAVRPVSAPTAETHPLVCALPSLGPHLGEAVPLTHPASWGNKCASPSLPRRQACGNDMCRLCSLNNLSTRGGGRASLCKLLQHTETCQLDLLGVSQAPAL